VSDQAEIDRLRDRQLDPSTGASQRLMIRCMVALSLTLVALGEVLSIVRHEPPRTEHGLLETLRARGMTVVAHHSIPVAERAALLARSRLLLNVSFLDATRTVEIPRLAVGFVAKKPILTEIYDDSELRTELREGVFGEPYERLADTAERLLSAPEERRERAELGHRLFTATSQAMFIQPAIERFFAWRSQQAGG
jgi:hypothetical protein